MNKLVHRLCTSLLFAFSLAFPAIAQTLYAETDTPLSTQEAADLRIASRFGIGYSTSEEGYDAFSRFGGFVPSGNTNGNAATNTGKITPVAAGTCNVP